MAIKTVYFTDSRIISISLDTDAVKIPTHQAADYEYCVKRKLNDEAFIGKSLKPHSNAIVTCSYVAFFFTLVHRCEDKAEEETFSAATALGITFIFSVLFSFPLGAFTVCCVLWCRSQTI